MRTLQEAIEEGLRQKEADEENSRQQEIQRQKIHQSNFDLEKEEFLKHFQERPEILLSHVVAATRNGETSFRLEGPKAEAEAINGLPGFKAVYYETKTGSDPEAWDRHWIEVTWTT